MSLTRELDIDNKEISFGSYRAGAHTHTHV